MVFSSPIKDLNKGIKKIEKGRGSKKLVDSLIKLINEHPDLVDDAVYQLIGIIQTDKNKTFSYSIDILLSIAEMESDPLANSSEAIVNLIRTSEYNLDINSTLKAMDILSIIAIDHPDLMQSAVPVLLKKLNHSNSHIRQASYYILDFIADPHPEFFSNYTLDLIRSLNGLNIDERIFAIKLIDEIASAFPQVIDESYDTLHDLAYKHPSMHVRQEAYDVFNKFRNQEEELLAVPEESLHKFEKDIIGLDEFDSDACDFGILADELAQRIEGVDFESSAAEMLKSFGMGHLIVKPEYLEEKTNDAEKPLQENDLQKLPPKPDLNDNAASDNQLHRIEHLITDPIIRARLAIVKEIEQQNNEENQDSAEIKEGHEASDDGFEKLSDTTMGMIHSIFTELSKEEWIINLGLLTRDGKLIDAIDPDSMDETISRKISDILSLEESPTRKEGFRNRISIELSDKFLVAMSIDTDYIFQIFTKTDIQFGMVLFELNKVAEKIEAILK